MQVAFQIRAARLDSDYDVARILFRAYAAGLEIDLSFQDFEDELDGLPGAYAPPGGELLVAFSGEKAVGCVALRPLDDDVCEMKRLYTAPQMRGAGLGRRLAERIIEEARRRAYRTMRLDTLASMLPAISLYRSLGFVPIEAYYDNPLPEACYFELDLKGSCGVSAR